MKKSISLLLILFILVAIPAFSGETPKNIILFSINGLDNSSLSLARMALCGPYGKLNLEKINKGGYLSTYSFDSWISDSASAMSTISTGERANNGELALDSLGAVKPTILEIAKDQGKAIGIVADCRLTYAPVAAFYTHSTNRFLESNFVKDLITLEPNLIFGGGKDMFLPKSLGGMRADGLDFINSSIKKGYKILSNRLDLVKCSQLSSKVLGIFTSDHMSYNIDRPADEPSFNLMVDKALKILPGKSDKGFILIIIADKISSALRNHDVKGFVNQFSEIDSSIGEVLAYQRLHSNTFVCIFSPYSTCPPFIGDRSSLNYLPNIKCSTDYMASKIDASGENVGWVLERYASINKLTEKEKSKIFYNLKNEFLSISIGDMLARRMGIYFLSPEDQKNQSDTFGNSTQTTPFFVVGPGAEDFDFFISNYDLGKKFISFIKD